MLEIPVHPRTSADVVDRIVAHTDRGPEPFVIGNLNLHGLYLYLSDATFRQYCRRADWVIVDGWPIWLLARLRSRRLSVATRIGSTDWLFSLFDRETDITIAAVGGAPESSRLAYAAVREKHPAVTWMPFDGFSFRWQGDPEEEHSLGDALRKADLVIVGLGMPRQEAWILEHSGELVGKTVANVGGCIDYIGGTQHLAPRWLGRVGLEWGYRLLADPRRLASRYLIEPFKLVGLVVLRPDLRLPGLSDR
ncbi:WecB/TagA/CpsF family glycosyltransferase [Georgenia sp. AZ-5]|uniref:WecB/TagA/CpsF family glycosyltransferase n=1 Tax=Georgenia sp. AZ-5 TaxID=3367526 RepID=UPI003753F743